MINFRFHIASLIAVFLALAVGIFVGSTVVDQAIVENLDRQIDRVERKADERKAENDRLKSDIDRLGAYAEGSAPFAVDHRLVGVNVLVVAERGVGGAVNRTATLLQQAGAVAPTIVWMEKKWKLDRPEDVDRLAGIVGDPGGSRAPDLLRRRGLEALAARLTESSGTKSSARNGSATSSTARTTSTTASASASELLGLLEKAGFVSVEDVGGRATSTTGSSGVDHAADAPETRVLVVGGTESDLLGTDVFVEMVRACVSAGAPTAAAEVYAETDGGPDRGAVVSGVIGDDALEATVTTVDDLDLIEGRVSAAIGLDELGSGTVGHYGYGSGASHSLPEWTGR